MKLRIVSWNCNMALDRKFERLLALRPDVAIIQECAAPGQGSRGWRPPSTDCDWVGFNPDKGLGIFTFGRLHLHRHRAYSDHYALYLPVQVAGLVRLNLLGVWAADEGSMPAGASNAPDAALRHYRRFLTEAPAVVAGDFNLLPQQMTRRPGAGDPSVVELLAWAGLRNAAQMWGGSAPTMQRTLYHQRKLRRGFVADYLFLPRREQRRLAAFTVGEPGEWLPWSDHVPLVAELALDRDSVLVRQAAWSGWLGRAVGRRLPRGVR